MARRDQLELLLECKQFELGFCVPGSGMHGQIKKEIEYLKTRLDQQGEQLD